MLARDQVECREQTEGEIFSRDLYSIINISKLFTEREKLYKQNCNWIDILKKIEFEGESLLDHPGKHSRKINNGFPLK